MIRPITLINTCWFLAATGAFATVLFASFGVFSAQQDTTPGEATVLPSAPTRSYWKAFFSTDGKELISVGEDRLEMQSVVDFWDIKTRRIIQTVTQPSQLTAVAFSRASNKLITAGRNGQVYIYSTTSRQLENTFPHAANGRAPFVIAVFPDGKHFVTADVGRREPGGLRLWPLGKTEPIFLGGKYPAVQALAVSKSGKEIAVGSALRLDIWNLNTLKMESQMDAEGSVISAEFSPDGKWLATGLGGGGKERITLWESGTWKAVRQLEGASDIPLALSFTKDSEFLVSCQGVERNVPSKLCVWRVSSGKLVYSFCPSEKDGCVEMALSPDNDILVTRGADGVLRTRDFLKIRAAAEHSPE